MLSIVIPVYNEAEGIANFINRLQLNLARPEDCELILVDGGSDDGTGNILKNIQGEQGNKASTVVHIKIVSSKKGRARQMNRGAHHAQGEILYFLHADSLPPKNFDVYIRTEIEKGNPAGCFKMKFDSSHWWLRLAGWLTKFSWKICRGGDQSQFITKSLFTEIGGFDERYIVYEDNVLIDELFKRKKFVVIPHSLITSARRYQQNGIWTLQYHFWIIHLKKWLGADAGSLSKYYSKHIGNGNSARIN